MSVKTRELIVEIPQYLYDESVKLTSLGLFRDLSDLVAAGLRRELQEAKHLVEFEPGDWEEGLARLRAQIRERKAKYGHEEPTEEEILAELRATRREMWENETVEGLLGASKMSTKTLTLSNVSDVFAGLPREDQEEIFNVGTAFRLLDLQKRLALAQENVKEFEAKYDATLDTLESEGLPEDAGYEMHEDYIEWHYWERVRKKTQNTLDVLTSVSEEHELA